MSVLRKNRTSIASLRNPSKQKSLIHKGGDRLFCFLSQDTPNGEEIFRLDEELDTKELLDEELLYKLVFDTDWKDKCFTRFIFKYDSKGQIIKVFDPLTNEEIVSPSNTHIEYYIREDDNFWASDLDGGHVKLTFFVVSDNTADKKTYSMYFGYQEQ